MKAAPIKPVPAKPAKAAEAKKEAAAPKAPAASKPAAAKAPPAKATDGKAPAALNTKPLATVRVGGAKKPPLPAGKKPPGVEEPAIEDLAEEEGDEEVAEAEGGDEKGPRLRSQPVEVQEIDVQVQRQRRQRLQPFTPRSYGPPPKSVKPAEVLEILAKHMGRAPTPPEKYRTAPAIELALFCIFSLGGNSAKASLEATQRLVAGFPEWNEFRVSEAYEFLETLSGLELVEPYDRCEQVLEFVDEVYQDQNKVDLEFLREMTPEDRLVALNRYRSLGPALSHYIALALQGFKGVLFHYSWARVAQRLAIVARSGSPKALVASMEKAFHDLDLVSAQVNMIDLGEVICVSKNPGCKSCCLVQHCKSRKV